MIIRTSILSLAVAALSCLAPVSLRAQETIGVQVGGGVAVVPKYEGAKDYRVVGAPIVAPTGLGQSDSRVQFRGLDHLQVRVFDYYGFEFGPLAGYRIDRDEDDGARLRGLGDIDGGLVVGGYAAYKVGIFTAAASYHHQVTGDDTGGLLKFNVEARQRVTAAVKLTASAGVTLADDDYMSSFFGVSAAQSANSGLARFDADAGIKDFNVGLVTDVTIDPRWSLKLFGKYARLVGDAADSPVVETPNQFSGGAALTYRFDFAR